MPDYYRFNSLRLTVADLWRWLGPSPRFLMFLLMKLLRQRSPDTWWTDPALLELPPRTPAPPDVVREVERRVALLRAAGFGPPHYCRVPKRGGGDDLAALLVADDRAVLATVAATRRAGAPEASLTTQIVFTSKLDGGGELATSDLRPFLPAPPGVERVSLSGVGPAELARRHRVRLAGRPWVPLPDDAEGLAQLFEADSRRSIAFLLERGYLEVDVPELPST